MIEAQLDPPQKARGRTPRHRRPSWRTRRADLTWLARERDYGRLRDNDDDSADDWKRGQP
jgi:hypothetical protein